ncbi:MAG: hypothetical protein BZY88_00975 [SAR202 cluster bacterium Io17-Chloro-G9]|nr:MAG: hypothetical protein BZY88_00975 [SAR202 cluster bacterium Io17-Chloro-G9]
MEPNSIQHRLYHDLAYLWPIISPPEEYVTEAEFWRAALRDNLGPGRHRILELGVGGGHNLSHLTSDFAATAVDLSPQMLALSQALNPEVKHRLGDMRTVRLGMTFDAVLIHDAIGYMLTEEDLLAAFGTAACHLRPGGVLLVAPDWVRESFQDSTQPRVFHWVRGLNELEVTVQEFLHDPDPDDTQMESTYTYIINEKGNQRVEQDTHVTGLFPIATWSRLFQEAGFQVETVKLPENQGGYGGLLFVGVLRPGESS